MKTSIYDYSDYKKLLVDLTEAGGRGKRKELAQCIGCQVSHITNVFTGNAHFSQEQAEASARFFGLSFQETEFLLLLIEYNRAGTTSLRKTYERILKERSQKYSDLKNRLKMPDSLRSEEEAQYYSSWQFGAVHVLVSIPQFQTREAIARKLQIPLQRIDEILAFLVDVGLCKKESQRFLPSRPLLHLNKKSPLISRHHANWRLKALQTIDDKASDDIHYSSVFTLSLEDYSRVKKIISDALSESFKVITESQEEDVAVVCLDLFKI